jgi:hypothetical protein
MNILILLVSSTPSIHRPQQHHDQLCGYIADAEFLHESFTTINIENQQVGQFSPGLNKVVRK